MDFRPFRRRLDCAGMISETGSASNFPVGLDRGVALTCEDSCAAEPTNISDRKSGALARCMVKPFKGLPSHAGLGVAYASVTLGLFSSKTDGALWALRTSCTSAVIPEDAQA